MNVMRSIFYSTLNPYSPINQTYGDLIRKGQNKTNQQECNPWLRGCIPWLTRHNTDTNKPTISSNNITIQKSTPTKQNSDNNLFEKFQIPSKRNQIAATKARLEKRLNQEENLNKKTT